MNGETEFRILGTLEVRRHGRDLRIPGTRQRALLAMLLLHANETVSADRLIDAVWGEQPPGSGLSALQVRVSQLRKTLDGGSGQNGAGPLKTRPSGYALEVEPDDLDVLTFDRLHAAGIGALDRGETRRASDLLSRALALWRGPALADLSCEPFARAELPRLNENRLRAVEARNEAELSLGRHASLIADLSAEVEAQPLREHLTAQLMVALYRAGRQAQALEVFRRTRERLAEELGIDPGDELTRLERAVLHHDPALDPPLTEAVARPSPPDPASRRTRSRRKLLAAFASFAVVVAAFAVVVPAIAWRARHPPAAIELASMRSAAIGAIDPASGILASALPVQEAPSSMVGAYGALWTTNYQANTVSEIDPATSTVRQASILVGAGPVGIAAGYGALWVANSLTGTVSRIDPSTDRVTATIRDVGPRPAAIAFGAGTVWVLGSLSGKLTRIDPATDKLLTPLHLDGSGDAITVGGGLVWVASPFGTVWGIDPVTGTEDHIVPVGQGANSVAFAGGKVWVADALTGSVSVVDPRRHDNVDHTYDVDGPLGLAVDSHSVWVASALGGSVSRIDQRSGAVHTFPVGDRPETIAVAGGKVWAGFESVASAHRGGTLRLRSRSSIRSLDPANAVLTSTAWQAGDVVQMTNDGLVAFNHAIGSDGTQLVPDLATSWPTLTDGGRTYTFHMWPYVRYSTGTYVRPSDIRNALERDFAPGALGAGAAYYSDLVGAPACIAHPDARCDLRRGVVTNDVAHTISLKLRSPDPDFLYQLALPPAFAVPPTADTPVASSPSSVPATGPYLVVLNSSRALVMERNPYFHEWSADAQPDGYVTRIVWTFGRSAKQSTSAVERGAADWTFDRPPPEALHQLLTRYPGRVHKDPSLETAFVSMDVTRPPFNNRRVRQAFNMAIDRTKLLDKVGGIVTGRTTCRLLPPGVAGYRPDCPDASQGGTGSSADVTRAKHLVALAHATGDRVTWLDGILNQIDILPAGRYLSTVLTEIGLRPKRVSMAAGPDTTLTFYSWEGDYPAASDFFQPLFSCPKHAPSNAISTGFCDPELAGLIHKALMAQLGDPSAAADKWAAIDRGLAQQSAVIPLYNPNEIDFVSARVGDFRSNPQLGPLLDQLWVQ